MKALSHAGRHGFRGGLRLIFVTFLEPLWMKALPYHVRVRQVASELRQRRLATSRLTELRSGHELLVTSPSALTPRTEELVSTEALSRLRANGEDDGSVVLADIDQDGFLSPRDGELSDVPTVSRESFMPRDRFALALVDVGGIVGVRKDFRGDVVSFVAELDAARALKTAGCRVPSILDVDRERLTITFEYIRGRVLREELARHGAILRDRDVMAHPSFRGLSRRERRAKRIHEGRAVLEEVVDRDVVERIFDGLKGIHEAGYVLHDIKFGNIILERSSGDPYFVDFDRARAYPRWSRLAVRVLRDRDYAKFNEHFGTDKMTFRRARQLAGRTDPALRPLYTPIYIEGGLRFGNIWDTDVGDGRWRYILRKHLPSLTGTRVLDLGANNGFNAIQMMRRGSHEVVAVESDDRAIRQGRLIKELFEWTDNRRYPLTYVHDSMVRLPQHEVGTFDLAVALCSIYYLDDDEITKLIRHVSTIAGTMVLQCNTDRRIRRSDPSTFDKASVEYAIEALQRNGFPATRVVAPPGYTRPLVIAGRSDPP